jgi:hypothetical protein
MGGHSGNRRTGNNKAFVPANLFNSNVITGKVNEPTNIGDILYKVPQGFKQSIESISPSSHGQGFEIAFCEHNDGYYMAQAIGTAPFVVTYKLNNNTWEILDSTDNQIRSTGMGVALQSYNDKLYLAVAHSIEPFVTVFYRYGNEWLAIGNFSDTPAGNGRGASFCIFENRLYLIIAHSTTPFVTTYIKDTDSENWIKLDNPNTIPASTGNGVSSIVYDGNMFMAIAHNNSPWVRSYKFNKDTSIWELITNPPTLPASTGNGVKLKIINENLYMSVAHNNSPFIRHYIYNNNTNDWSNLDIVSGTNIPPTNAFKSILFSYNNTIYSSTAHNNEPFITTSKLINGSWIKLDDPSPIAEHNFTTNILASYYLEMIEIRNEIFMALSLQFQPFLKVYKWDGETERWSDSNITNLFPSPTGSVFNAEAIDFNGVLYVGFSHAVSPFMSIYKREPQYEFRIMKRPETLPAGTGSGCKFAIYNNKLYFAIAHTTAPRFRMYVLNENTELWEAIDPPENDDLPTGNGIECSIRVYNDKLYVSIAHVTTPFITTYTWTELNGWTKLPTPTTIMTANATDGAMKVYANTLHLSITSIATNQNMVTSYIFDPDEDEWVFVDRNVDISTSSGAGASGVDYEEWENDFYLAIGHNLQPYNRILKWNDSIKEWENQPNFLPTVKTANASRVSLYNDSGVLYFTIVSLDSANVGRLNIFKRLNNTWISYYSKDILAQMVYGIRFIKYDNKLWLIVGTQFSPFFKLFLLTENEFNDVWSKQPIEYYDRVGISKENGNANENIEIYISKW